MELTLLEAIIMIAGLYADCRVFIYIIDKIRGE